MEYEHTISGLLRKRGEIAKRIEGHRIEAARLTNDMQAIERALHAFGVQSIFAWCGCYIRPGMGADRALPPPPRQQGRPRTTDLRDVMNAILCMASAGRQSLPGRRMGHSPRGGRMPPQGFPPPSTVQRYFHDWRVSGLWRTVSNHLVMAGRELEGREASQTAGMIRWPSGDCIQSPKGDSQSVKTTENGGVCGFDPPLGECVHSPVGRPTADMPAPN